MAAPLAEAFLTQARACARLGSPFMARLCTLLAARLRPGTPLTDRLFAWPGDIGPSGASVPLRLAGALHALHLRGHPELGTAYPPADVDDDRLWAAVASALAGDAAFIDAFIDSPPQTNELRRSAALIPAARLLAARFGLPLALSELGASAGLNLLFDRFALRIGDSTFGQPAHPALVLAPDWNGPLPAAATPVVAERRGVDLRPLDPADSADRTRLLAYLWPDQPGRRRMTEAALALGGARPDHGEAIDWLAGRLAQRPGQVHLVYTTIAWQYFPAAMQRRGAALIAAAGARATPDAPLAWFGMEADGREPGAGLWLRLWPGNQFLDLGRADFHGRWIDWRGQAGATDRLAEAAR